MRISRISSAAFSIAFCLNFLDVPVAEAASKANIEQLKSAMKYWQDSGPVCRDSGDGFISKEYKDFRPCNDGDSVLFSGLLCSVGESLGCQTVKRSQDESGKWWRSPRNKRLRPDEGGSETNFSNDHAAGVWLYILHERDVGAFKKWSHWMQANLYGGVLPQYCKDMRCVFKLADCPIMDRVALSLDVGNPLCESDLMPGTVPKIYGKESIQDLRNAYNGAVELIKKVPGGRELLRLDVLSPKFAEMLRVLERKFDKLEEDRIRLNTLIRASSDSAGIIARLNAVVNDPGYSRHSVAVSSYILLKYGGVPPSGSALQAARSVATQEPKNAFFEYVAHGATDKMLRNILDGCRASGNVSEHPRFQWIWERADNDPSKPKDHLMYWDCLFTARLYLSGPLPASNLPGLPLMQALFQAERAAFEAGKKEADTLVKMVKDFKKHPDKSLEYIAKFPITSGTKMGQGATEGALKGLGVPSDKAKEAAKVLVPDVPTPDVGSAIKGGGNPIKQGEKAIKEGGKAAKKALCVGTLQPGGEPC